MNLLIDAANIRAGGGVTHLRNILLYTNAREFGFSQVCVYACQRTLDSIPDKPWIKKKTHPLLERSLPYRLVWQAFHLKKIINNESIDLLFVPGGTCFVKKQPLVSMFQNFAVFDKITRRLYFPRPGYFRFLLLSKSQLRTFKLSASVIFLSEHTREIILPHLSKSRIKTPIIPHGVELGFFQAIRQQKSIYEYTDQNPCKILYVSTVDLYKHHVEALQAIKILRDRGYPVVIEFIGSAYQPAFNALRKQKAIIDNDDIFSKYIGTVPYHQLKKNYHGADIFLFASRCETFGNVLLEAACAGLPIACSNLKPMSDMFKDKALFFDPSNPQDIANQVEKLLLSAPLREKLAEAAQQYATGLTWESCANKTFNHLATVAKREKENW